MRYAVYFTPGRNDALTDAAATWLGRDAYDNCDVPWPADSGLDEDEWRSLTAEPRRYAFHATLKAPFALADGRTETELVEAVNAFAAKTAAFDIPALTVAGLGPFFALVPVDEDAGLEAFASTVVEAFEPFRAPLSAADIARRNPDNLTERQRIYLDRYGYPYVMEEFRFHMTLTGPVAPERREAVHTLLSHRFAAFLGKPRRIDALTIFVETARGEPFRVHQRIPLATDLENRVVN
ncbi:DUF1045 domain-containing protein [Neorhizobium sp. NPDC001467]|uniref:DUF1045 domain-containing protein n=1 Tax=Neorhizobium sp. NPDC001467 TaxID=3390595 RepID=UPI003CFEC4F7